MIQADDRVLTQEDFSTEEFAVGAMERVRDQPMTEPSPHVIGSSPHIGIPSREILGVRLHAPTVKEATGCIIEWAQRRESRATCATGAHGVIEAQDDDAFRDVLNSADLNHPDGMPLVWMLRRLGVVGAERVYGPALTLHVCRAAAVSGVSVALYGSTPETLARLQVTLPKKAPGLKIATAISPPFRPLTEAEDARFTEQLVGSGAGVVLVGLGCPRQERWCLAHRGRIPAVLMAVGAAFDFHAGTLRQAPSWMQHAGLEWLFRLASEPRRLAGRYGRIVPRFLAGAARQLVTSNS